MAKFEIIMPKLGESVIEATITKWLKVEGDQIEEDDPIVEIATDKVDSEIPSPVEGKIVKTLFAEGDVVAVGTVIALVEMDGGSEDDSEAPKEEPAEKEVVAEKEATTEPEPAREERAEKEVVAEVETKAEPESDKEGKPAEEEKTDTKTVQDYKDSQRFYSPLVKSIAKAENISLDELEKISGSGKEDRVTKADILGYIENRGKAPAKAAEPSKTAEPSKAEVPKAVQVEAPKVTTGAGDQVIAMDRMRKLIADHMVMSKQVSPHVTSFIDVDVTNIVNWRNKVKDSFQKREGQKITFTPIFFEAAAAALKEYPQVNASVDGSNMILRKNINIGMATALPNGNLIVPVIKNADEKNLLGITKAVNDLANRARNNKLTPDEIQGGTFTITNFGSFDSLTGTPIINQPQVAILAVGAIRKQPAVIETEYGDVIAIRHIMILALAYDHRIVDGALGGMYLKKMKELLENFDPNREV